MKGSKQSTTKRSVKPPVAKSKAKAGTKVVDVALSERKSRKKAAAAPTKGTEKPKKTKSERAPKSVARKAPEAEKKRLDKQAKSKVAAQLAPKAVEAVPAEKETLAAALLSPSIEVLRPFREAAKQNRKLQRERERAASKRSSFLAKPPRKGKKYAIDLRIHSPASQGFFSTGGVDPGPALVRLARVKGLHAIGLTDYYSAAYVDLVKEKAQGTSVTVIPGLDLRCEVNGCDEIGVLALFPESHTAADLWSVLERLHVPEWAYGRQDYTIRIPFAQVLETIEGSGGILIPSRIDKTPFRQLAIECLVEEFGIHAFDLVHPEAPEYFRANWPSGEFTFFSFSNANALGQIGSRSSKVKLTSPGFEGIRELVQRRVLN
ncbi:MAG: hypothetical protein KDD69_13340 [Bdellovibrionales bacterium]|nr:hypothetical protein [Bdellovibrionales bacterium]